MCELEVVRESIEIASEVEVISQSVDCIYMYYLAPFVFPSNLNSSTLTFGLYTFLSFQP